jgi:excisionase family DNA binding protein
MPVTTNELTTKVRCISADDAATYLGISRRTFERAVKGGTLPQGIRVGERRLVWDRHALDAYLDQLVLRDQPTAQQSAEPRRTRRRS